MPYISIIIPAYNADRTIAETLDSIKAQSFSNYEVIICDDGSIDRTIEVSRRYSEADSRFSILQLHHGGAGAARNAGMDVATGNYLYFLDADDCILPNALQTLFDAAFASHPDVVVARSHYFDDVTHIERPIDFSMQDVPCNCLLEGDSLPDRPFQSFVGWPWDKLFSASFVKDRQLRFQCLRSSNDALFVFLALCEAKRIICLDLDLFAHRTNNMQSLEHTRSKSWRNSIEAMSALGNEIAIRGLRERVWVSYANWVSHFSYWSMASLDREALSLEVVAAFDEFLSAVQLEPELYYSTEDKVFAQLSKQNRLEIMIQYIKLRFNNEIELSRLYSNEKNGDALISVLQNDLAVLTQKADELSRENIALANQIKAMRKSYSWRLGNLIVKPISRVKQLLVR